MYYIDYSTLKKEKKVPLIFITVGFIIFVIFLFIFLHGMFKFNKYDAKVSATYIDFGEKINMDGYIVYTPTYHFRVNNINYKCTSYVTSQTMPKKEGLVYYNSSDPHSCMTDYVTNTNYFFLIGVGIGTLFIIIGAVLLCATNNKKKKMKYLEKNGKLIVGIPYTMESTGIFQHGKRIYRIALYYTNSNGESIKLYGDPRFDGKKRDADGLADLLIDPNNTSNYFVDFEIKHDNGAPFETYKISDENLQQMAMNK